MELKTYDGKGLIAKEPLFSGNYFVPRGYAFVDVDLAGTNRSTGCEDAGGREGTPAHTGPTAPPPSPAGRPARSA